MKSKVRLSPEWEKMFKQWRERSEAFAGAWLPQHVFKMRRTFRIFDLTLPHITNLKQLTDHIDKLRIEAGQPIGTEFCGFTNEVLIETEDELQAGGLL